MAVTAAQPKVDSGTRDRILDAAEELFVERGFSATSLRAIAGAAEVNLAATHYHFGSKYGLLAEVFHRRIQPIDEARLAALDELEARYATPKVQQIIQAFLSPLLDDNQDPVLLERLPRLAGRIMGEPESLTKPLLEAEFTEVAGRYQSALRRALPDAPMHQIAWNFHFLIGSMIHLMRMAPLGQTPSPESLREGVKHLVTYTVAAIEGGTQR